jgi:predicted ATPase
LPFVDDLRIEKFADKSLLFSLQEKYTQEHYIPASFLSEGTINLIALIIALYFDQRPLTIIEEPERFVHPFLISKVVNMIEDAAKQKQIIITTHNPETIRYVNLEDILLISRDKDGFSTISKPSKSEQVKNFLQSEIGIAELFAQDLLGV